MDNIVDRVSELRLASLFEGDEARGLRELGGIMASDHTPCFQKKDIATLFDNDRWVLEAPPEAIYITIDPNGGGASDFGMAAGCFDQGRLVVRNFFLFSSLVRVCVFHMAGYPAQIWRKKCLLSVSTLYG